jgi:hypothetical protein
MNVRKLVLTLLLGFALMGGCKQSDGERCERDDDCKSGLECCPSFTCQASCTEQSADAAGLPEASVQNDAAQNDAAQNDAEMTVDASVTQDASP